MFVKLQSCRALTSLRTCRRDKVKGESVTRVATVGAIAQFPSFVDISGRTAWNVPSEKKKEREKEKTKWKKKKKRNLISRREFNSTGEAFENDRLKSYYKTHFAGRCFLNISPIILLHHATRVCMYVRISARRASKKRNKRGSKKKTNEATRWGKKE